MSQMEFEYVIGEVSAKNTGRLLLLATLKPNCSRILLACRGFCSAEIGVGRRRAKPVAVDGAALAGEPRTRQREGWRLGGLERVRLAALFEAFSLK